MAQSEESLQFERLGREYAARLDSDNEAMRLMSHWQTALKLLRELKAGTVLLDDVEMVEGGFRVAAKKKAES